MGTLPHNFKLSRTYYQHSNSPDFRRIITTTHDYKDELGRLAFVQYSFDHSEHSIDLKPHGNSKEIKPFSRTKPSVLGKLKASVQTKAPRKALREVEMSQGGVSGAKSACDLPRNRKQVKNLKYQSPMPSNNLPSIDVLAHVMQMCKGACGTDSVFVQSVEAAPEPMCVLATPQQLVDMERFCTGSPSSVMCIDPTFNLGTFYVTPTTYHNLLVKTSAGCNPILLGPILIHQSKTLRLFHYFASTLIRLNPRLVDLRAYGTDGETEMIKALEMCFPKATHLRCTNHLRQNIKDKLRSLNLPQSVKQEIIADIFGKAVGSHFQIGLADAESEVHFNKMLDGIKTKWSNLERSSSPGEIMPQFHAWFCRYQTEVFLKSVLPKVRRQAGCRDPSSHFTTNSSESMNHLIKREVDWKESKLPNFIESLRTIVSDQEAELERAILRRGEWRFTSEYNSLVISDPCWFSQMNDAAKRSHMKKVFSQRPVSDYVPAAGSATLQTILSVSVEESGITGVSQATLQNMWMKAESLVKCSGQVIRVPWSKNDKERLVRSSSSVQPHLVTTDSKNANLYRCDANCQMFKGFCICSHVVAAAHDNGDLKLFLDSIKKIKPNLSAIANYGMSSGTGRKGGVAKRKRSQKTPIESRSVRPFLDTSIAAEHSSSNSNPSCLDTSLGSVTATERQSGHSLSTPLQQAPSGITTFPSLGTPSGIVNSHHLVTAANASSQSQIVFGANVINYPSFPVLCHAVLLLVLPQMLLVLPQMLLVLLQMQLVLPQNHLF